MSVVATVLMAAGVALVVVAAIGVVRLADPLQRMHSATKAGTLGTTLIVLGAVAQGAKASTGLLTILFLLLTLPIGAQLLARAAYRSGARLEGIDDDPLAQVVAREDE